MLDVIFFRTFRGNELAWVWLSNFGEKDLRWLENEEVYQEVGVCHNK